MGFHVNVEDLKNYKEMLVPAGKYLVEVIKGQDKKAASGRDMMNLTLKILDTIPPGEETDTENFLDPIDSIQFKLLMAPMEGDKIGTVNMFNKNVSDYLNNFDVEAADPEKLVAADFVGTSGGITIKYEKLDKDEPDSDLRAVVDKSCPAG